MVKLSIINIFRIEFEVSENIDDFYSLTVYYDNNIDFNSLYYLKLII